jgi:hypothetical protein
MEDRQFSRLRDILTSTRCRPFAMSDQLMSRAEIIRRLRLVASQRPERRPLTMQAIAARTGLSRMAVYRAMNGELPDLVVHLLSQVLREVPVQEMIERASCRPFNNGYDRFALPQKRPPSRPGRR